MEGAWFKNCNCAPGCPCDFNQDPTQGYCEGMVAMRVDKGNFGDVDLSGVIWGGVGHWDGPIHYGGGSLQPFVDEKTTDDQRDAIMQVASGQHGDTLFEIIAAVCPDVKEPIVAPIEFEFDLESRTGHIKVGDVIEAEVETLRGIDPPEPYRVLVRIPGGFEYTGENEEAETALSKRIVSKGEVKLDITDGHSTMAFVRHGNEFQEQYTPTVAGG
jgi:hypothetical protein